MSNEKKRIVNPHGCWLDQPASHPDKPYSNIFIWYNSLSRFMRRVMLFTLGMVSFFLFAVNWLAPFLLWGWLFYQHKTLRDDPSIYKNKVIVFTTDTGEERTCFVENATIEGPLLRAYCKIKKGFVMIRKDSILSITE